MSFPASLQVLVVELESLLSCAALNSSDSNKATVNDIIGAIVVYCNSYSLMHRGNKLVVLAVTTDSCETVYPTASDLTFPADVTDSSFLVPNHHRLSIDLSQAFFELLKSAAESTGPRKADSPTTGVMIDKKRYFSNCLSTALCIINKQKQFHSLLEARILIIQFDKDKALNYNSLMNCVFSAQKLDVMIDALLLTPFDSHFMQQACFLTGGLYVKHSDLKDALQVLHFNFLSDKNTRKKLNLPLQVLI